MKAKRVMRIKLIGVIAGALCFSVKVVLLEF
jgi:hypothetical protein